MHINIFLVLLLFHVKGIFAQNYSDFESHKDTLFFENFDGDVDEQFFAKHLPYELGGIDVSMKNWRDEMKGVYDIRMYSRSSAGFSNEYNWEVECRMKYRPNDEKDYGILILLGKHAKMNRQNHLYLKIQDQKSKVFYEMPYSGRRPKIKKADLEGIIKWNEFNKFTIRRVGQEVQLFVNEIFFFSLPYYKIEGSGLLEIRLARLYVQMDYIRVSKLLN